MGTGVDTSHCDTSHCARRSRWTFDECAGRRPAIEAVAARPRRGAGANEGLKPRLSRCVAFAALPGAVCRPPRCCPAARRCAQQLRRCGLLVPCARSAAEPRALRPAATGCWCPVPAPPPGGRPPSPPQPRPTCPPAPGSPVATQIAQQPHRAATRHFFVAGPTRLATILPRASRRARPLPSTRMADALEHQHRTAWLIFYFSPSIFLCVSTASWSARAEDINMSIDR